MSNPLAALDAPVLYQSLLAHLRSETAEQDPGNLYWVGIASGGVWLAERLARSLGGYCGVISSALHRDDFAQRGLASSSATNLPVPVQGADIWLIDDVLYTGRTVRAVLNELFDYGRPARVRLAVLVDRGQHELPIMADYAAAHVKVPAQTILTLSQDEQGQLAFSLNPRRI